MTKAKFALFLTCLVGSLSTGCGVKLVEVKVENVPHNYSQSSRYLATHCDTSKQCYEITTPAH